MGLHDLRRAGATFLAMAEPTAVGLIPGLLQHASPAVNEKHYNLARSVEARAAIEVYTDYAISGSSLKNRPGIGRC